MGRAAKPKSAKQLENRTKKPRNKKRTPSIERPIESIERPEILNGLAAEEWDRVIVGLQQQHTIDPLAIATLCIYCQAWADWHWAVETINSGVRIQLTSRGFEQIHPAFTIKKQAEETIRKTSAELGLTEAARQKLDVQRSTPAGNVDDFAKSKGK